MIPSRPGVRWRPGQNPFAWDTAVLLGESARENLAVPPWKLETLRVGSRQEAETNNGFPPGGMWYEYVPDPAVGTNFVWVNTYAGVALQPFYLKFRLIASAAVGTRLPGLIIADGGGSIMWTYGDIALAGGMGAGTNRIAQYYTNREQTTQGQGFTLAPVSATEHWLANIVILPGWQIRTNFGATLDVADQITDIAIGLRVVA